MKKIIQRIRDWIIPFLQAGSLLLIIVLTLCFDLPLIINNKLTTLGVDPLNASKGFIIDLVLKLNNKWILCVLFIILTLLIFRKYNKTKMLNAGNMYHDHFYASYWFCSKILGYKKCNLVRVPIYMQFKLLIRDTFSEYFCGFDTDYIYIEDDDIKVNVQEYKYSNTINLVLPDTYSIDKEYLPKSTRDLSTIIISSNSTINGNRYFNRGFCNKIQETVRLLPANVTTINLFSTLNPKHSHWIARNVFMMAGRCEIKSLIVYPQPFSNGNWSFAEKGYVIYR